MATKTKKRRRPSPRQNQYPKQRAARRPRAWWLPAGAILGLIVLAVILALTVFNGGSGGGSASAGLPDTPDYHSLLVDPNDPQKLVLGTHGGLYASSDGGRHWRLRRSPGTTR